MANEFKDAAARLKHFADGVSSGVANADLMLRNRVHHAFKDVTELTGTLEVTVINYTSAACRVVRASVVNETTGAAGANSRDLQLKYDDGALGADTNLSSLYDGTATAITAGQRNALTITANVIVPAGSRIFFESTHNGTGVALNDCHFEAEVIFD